MLCTELESTVWTVESKFRFLFFRGKNVISGVVVVVVVVVLVLHLLKDGEGNDKKVNQVVTISVRDIIEIALHFDVISIVMFDY